jgi:maleylpyruvate isomerase
MKLVLYNYWRSSSSHRMRIGLHLKQLPFEYVAINLLEGAQKADAYLAKNPMGQVPALEITEDDGSQITLVQSIAILEYLEERWPEHPLYPATPALRARARALAEVVNSGIQPFQNPPTLRAVKKAGGEPEAWAKEWIGNGLAGYAKLAATTAGTFSVGDEPSIADVCLIPQLAAARRFGVDYTQYEPIARIESACLALPAFAAALPDRQPDAVKS